MSDAARACCLTISRRPRVSAGEHPQRTNGLVLLASLQGRCLEACLCTPSGRETNSAHMVPPAKSCIYRVGNGQGGPLEFHLHNTTNGILSGMYLHPLVRAATTLRASYKHMCVCLECACPRSIKYKPKMRYTHKARLLPITKTASRQFTNIRPFQPLRCSHEREGGLLVLPGLYGKFGLRPSNQYQSRAPWHGTPVTGLI